MVVPPIILPIAVMFLVFVTAAVRGCLRGRIRHDGHDRRGDCGKNDSQNDLTHFILRF